MRRSKKSYCRRGLLAVTGSVVGVLMALQAIAAGLPGAALDLRQLQGAAKIHALIDGVVIRQRSLHSLRAEFVQVKRSELLLEPVTSTGHFLYLAPDQVRWDYLQPETMVVLFTQDNVTTYHPRQRLAERVKVSRRDRRFLRALAGTLPLDDLTDYFRIRLEDPGAPEAYRLRLEPHERTLQKKVESLIVEVDRELLLPVVVEFNETDGDSTRYEFHDLELDSEIEPSRFRLELEDGVRLHTIDASAGLG